MTQASAFQHDAAIALINVVVQDLRRRSGRVLDQGAAGRLEVVVRGGRVVRVRPGFDAGTLARVVQTLEALPC